MAIYGEDMPGLVVAGSLRHFIKGFDVFWFGVTIQRIMIDVARVNLIPQPIPLCNRAGLNAYH